MTTTEPPLRTLRNGGVLDAVLAIAITLLVLDLHHRSSARANHLFSALLADWPRYVRAGQQLRIIGLVWLHHHRLFGYSSARITCW